MRCSCKITKVQHILDRSIAYLSSKKRQQSLDRLQSCNLAQPGITVQQNAARELATRHDNHIAYEKGLTWEYVPTTIHTAVVIVIAGKEACMVTFLYHHKCNRWLVIRLKRCTSLSDGIKLIKEDLIELPFTYTIPAIHGHTDNELF
jgi:hypothetical protein